MNSNILVLNNNKSFEYESELKSELYKSKNKDSHPYYMFFSQQEISYIKKNNLSIECLPPNDYNIADYSFPQEVKFVFLIQYTDKTQQYPGSHHKLLVGYNKEEERVFVQLLDNKYKEFLTANSSLVDDFEYEIKKSKPKVYKKTISSNDNNISNIITLPVIKQNYDVNQIKNWFDKKDDKQLYETFMSKVPLYLKETSIQVCFDELNNLYKLDDSNIEEQLKLKIEEYANKFMIELSKWKWEMENQVYDDLRLFVINNCLDIFNILGKKDVCLEKLLTKNHYENDKTAIILWSLINNLFYIKSYY